MYGTSIVLTDKYLVSVNQAIFINILKANKKIGLRIRGCIRIFFTKKANDIAEIK